MKLQMFYLQALDPVDTTTDPNGSVPKLAHIGFPFTLDLWIRTHLGLGLV